MREQEYLDFRKSAGVSGSKHFKVSNSWGAYDYYKYYRKNRPKDKKYVLSEGQYYKILRGVNDLLVEEFVDKGYLLLPHKMGELEVVKQKVRSTIVNGKLKTNRQIDWDSTLELWYKDKEMYGKKRLIYFEDDHIPKFRYIKTKSKYANRAFYEFLINVRLRRRICRSMSNRLLCFDNYEINNLYNG